MKQSISVHPDDIARETSETLTGRALIERFGNRLRLEAGKEYRLRVLYVIEEEEEVTEIKRRHQHQR